MCCHFCASPGTPRCWSLCLEGLYRKRRTVPLVRLCSAWFPRSSQWSFLPLPALCLRSSVWAALFLRVHVAIRFRSSEHGCDRGLAFTASASGVHSRRSLVFATLRSCRRCGCVPRGQRAQLNADMLELIDRFARLVEPVAVESCAPPPVLVLSPAASTSSAASGRCSRMSFPRGLVEGLLLPESSLRAAPVASLRLLLLDDRDLSLFCHVAKRCVTLFLDVLLHVLHLGSHPAC